MNAAEAIAHLVEHFVLVRAGADEDGQLEYDFDGPFAFVATVLDETVLQIAVGLPELGTVDDMPLARRLLEATLQGVETGAGQIGLHPVLGPALVEVIDTSVTDIPGFEMRFVNFTLHAEFWLNEGAAALRAETAPPPLENALDEVRIRL